MKNIRRLVCAAVGIAASCGATYTMFRHGMSFPLQLAVGALFFVSNLCILLASK